jgi:hypothetical protein
MVLFGEKRLRCVLAGYLVLVILGTFAFSMAETFDSSEFEIKRAVSGGFLAPTEIAVDWLAEGTAIISKAEEYSSPLRNGTLRTSAPSGVQNTGALLVQSSLNAIKKTQHPDIKNTIILKLRI